MTPVLDFSPCSIPWQLEDTLDGVDGQNNWLSIQPSPRHVDLRNNFLYCFGALLIIKENTTKNIKNVQSQNLFQILISHRFGRIEFNFQITLSSSMWPETSFEYIIN